MTRRSWLVYGTLLAIWVILIGWQVAEHSRVKRSAQVALINRSKDISNTLGVLMRSQRFFGVISKERLETALSELVNPELHSIALLNATDEVVASAGPPIDAQSKGDLSGGESWGDQTVTLVNLVDLGTNVTQDLERTNLTIVMPVSELRGSFETNRTPPPVFDSNGPPIFSSTNAFGGATPNNPPRRRFNWRRRGATNDLNTFEKPDWMKEEEYKSIIQKKGVHSFVIVMSTQPLTVAANQDLWLRAVIGILGTVSVVGCAMAWHNLTKTSDLQIRLVRASELNSHLKQMNLAAAGLAHETRNPLNIIRGLAQMISKQEEASTEIRKQSRDILNETDRVTAQLNEFINYSRPREIRYAAVSLKSVGDEVVRALTYDVEEKKIRLRGLEEQVVVKADEQLVRQVLFNLVLNAIQAAEMNGEIELVASKSGAGEATLEIRDTGPGVAPEHRAEIFKPYFTTHKKGTGLGLALVRQIVLAHGWEIGYVPNEPRGAIFRLTHLKLASTT
jgi:signal transduction histidine kinase